MILAALDIEALHKHLNNVQYTLEESPPEAFLESRRRMMREEFGEFLDDFMDRMLVGTLHEGLDTIVTILGTLIARGYTAVQIQEGWERIQAANMAKVPDPAGGKWLKPEGWKKPDLSSIVTEALNETDNPA